MVNFHFGLSNDKELSTYRNRPLARAACLSCSASGYKSSNGFTVVNTNCTGNPLPLPGKGANGNATARTPATADMFVCNVFKTSACDCDRSSHGFRINPDNVLYTCPPLPFTIKLSSAAG